MRMEALTAQMEGIDQKVIAIDEQQEAIYLMINDIHSHYIF